jgi:hypothetical protein
MPRRQSRPVERAQDGSRSVVAEAPELPDLALDVSADEARVWRERLADYFEILRKWDEKSRRGGQPPS